MPRLLLSLSLATLPCLLSLPLKATSVISRNPVRIADGAEFFLAPAHKTEDTVTDPKPVLPRTNGSTLIFITRTSGSENRTHNTEIQSRTSHQASIPPSPDEPTYPKPFSTPENEDDYDVGIIFEAEINLQPCPTHTLEATGEDPSLQPEPIGRGHLFVTSSEGHQSTEFTYQPRQVPVESAGGLSGSYVTSTTTEGHESGQTVDPTDTSSTIPVPIATCTTPNGAMNENPDENTKALVSGTGLKIAVCARQYPSKFMFYRGYGDIASGIRGLEILQERFPEAEFTFIVEHFSQDENEWLTIETMSSIPAVQTFFLKGEIKNEITVQKISEDLEQQHRLNSEQAIANADFIFHAPYQLIALIDRHKEKYATKLLQVSTYVMGTEPYTEDNQPDHIIWEVYSLTGFDNKRLYLNDRKHYSNRFNSKVLDEQAASGTPAWYFIYYGHTTIIQAMLNTLLLIEGTSDRDTVLISTLSANNAEFLLEEIQQAVAIKSTDSKDEVFRDFTDWEVIRAIINKNIILGFCGLEKIKIVFWDSAGSEQEITFFDNPQGKGVKSIRLIHPFPVEENDLRLLRKYSLINLATGDISMSDILTLGKIPLVAEFKTTVNYYGLRKALTEFSAGNKDREALVKGWQLATDCILGFKFHNELKRASEELIQPVHLLGSRQWRDFEKAFTDWLKAHSDITPFIIQKAEDVIKKRKPSRSLPDSEYMEETSL